MVHMKLSALGFALCILGTACSTMHSITTVEVATLMTYPNPVSEGKVMRGKSSDMLRVGQQSANHSTLFPIRECNATHTQCADAVVKPVVSYMVQNLRGDEATIRFNVSYDVGRGQSIETKGLASTTSSSLTMDPSVDVISGHQNVSRTAPVKLGEIRKIQLPNGVRLDVCVALAAANGLPQPHGCDFNAIQTDPRVEDAVRPL
jgi:hypothetical protein